MRGTASVRREPRNLAADRNTGPLDFATPTACDVGRPPDVATGLTVECLFFVG